MLRKVQLYSVNMGGKIQYVCSIMILGFRIVLRPVITDSKGQRPGGEEQQRGKHCSCRVPTLHWTIRKFS